MEEKLASSPLIPPPSEIDLEAGAGARNQLQCRICLETDGESRPGPAAAASCCFATAGLVRAAEGGSDCLRSCSWVCREGLHRAVQVQGDVEIRAPRLPRPLEGRKGERFPTFLNMSSSILFLISLSSVS
jgi:hypothetical protein